MKTPKQLAELRDIIKNTKGKLFACEFKKKSGELRKMLCIYQSHPNASEGNPNYHLNSTQMLVQEISIDTNGQYKPYSERAKTINLETIQWIREGGRTHAY